MMQELQIGKEAVPYSIAFSKRSRHVRFTMHPGGHLTVTIPSRISLDRVKPLIEMHQAWILKQYSRQTTKQVQQLPPITDLVSYRTHRASADDLVKRMLGKMYLTECLPPHTTTIKNHRTRWGSCSKRGNLNFNYRIVFLPPELVRYVVAHEVCHLYELNHSLAFWKHVAQRIPDHRACRARLRGYVWRSF